MLTCSHVLATGCGSAEYRCDLRTETYEPDYALLRASGPCFWPEIGGTVGCAGEPEAFQGRHEPVVLSHRRGREGVIHSVHSWVEYSGRTHKFPHIMIRRPMRIILELFAWPPWGRTFSVRGDSGSWVIGRDRTMWYGLLVSGNRHLHFSYAALAAPLRTFLLSVARSHFQSPTDVQFKAQRTIAALARRLPWVRA